MCKPPPGCGSGMPSSVHLLPSLPPSLPPSFPPFHPFLPPSFHSPSFPSLPSLLPSPPLPPSFLPCLPPSFPPPFLPSLLPSLLLPSLPPYLPPSLRFSPFIRSLLCLCVSVSVLLFSLYSNLAAASIELGEHCISSPASLQQSTSACAYVCLSFPLTIHETDTRRDVNLLNPALMVVFKKKKKKRVIVTLSELAGIPRSWTRRWRCMMHVYVQLFISTAAMR